VPTEIADLAIQRLSAQAAPKTAQLSAWYIAALKRAPSPSNRRCSVHVGLAQPAGRSIRPVPIDTRACSSATGHITP